MAIYDTFILKTVRIVCKCYGVKSWMLENILTGRRLSAKLTEQLAVTPTTTGESA